MSGRNVDFNALPRQLREDFSARTRSKGTPESPILAERTPSLAKALFGSLALLAFGGMMVVGAFRNGFGLANPDGVQGIGQGIFYAVMIALILYNLLATWRRFALRRSMPFLAGKYLFAWDLVDARSHELIIHPLSELKELRISQTKVVLLFKDGSQQELLAGSRKTIDEGIKLLQSRQAELRAAAQASDVTRISQLDPFAAVRTQGWKLGSAAQAGEPATARAVPIFLRWRLAISAAAAIGLVAAVLPVRNYMSDRLMFAEAQRAGTEAALNLYTANGWLHKDEAEAAVPKAAFNDAKHAASVTALRRVVERFPKAGFDAEADVEIARLYDLSLARFREQAATSDPGLLPFMEKLLSLLRTQRRPVVQLQFKRPTDAALAVADARYAKGVGPGGANKVAPVAPHFSGASAGDRERKIERALDAAFSKIFPQDVLKVASPDKVTPDLPILLISYEIEPSGTMYSSEKAPGTLFVGVIVRFQTAMTIPAVADVRRMKFEARPADRFTVRTASNAPAGDQAVYVTMADTAFEQLGTNLRAAFFRPESEAFRQDQRRKGI
jgi:hypothetical protein